MDKYKRYRVNLIRNEIKKNLNVNDDWIDRFWRQPQRVLNGRSIFDCVEEDEFDVVLEKLDFSFIKDLIK